MKFIEIIRSAARTARFTGGVVSGTQCTIEPAQGKLRIGSKNHIFPSLSTVNRLYLPLLYIILITFMSEISLACMTIQRVIKYDSLKRGTIDEYIH